MGQGGGVQLLNGTRYHWVLVALTSNEMNSWPFPQVIPAGNTSVNYVEWSASGSPAGVVEYMLNGTGLSFTLSANSNGSYDIAVTLNGISTPKLPSGSVVDLGWNEDGDIYFLLSGEIGSFNVSTLPLSSWMHDNLPMLGARTMREICITGSHDAGMGSDTFFPETCWAQTQNVNVLGQLQAGARYFDIRPVIFGGEHMTGHYTGNGPDASGTLGESIRSIIEGILQFTAQNAELIVLNLSHDVQADRNNAWFNQNDWDGLFEGLGSLPWLYPIGDTTADLSRVTLNDFIGNGIPAVLIVVDPNDATIQLGNYASLGFCTKANFDVYNQYADTVYAQQMQEFEFAQMRQQKQGRDSGLFLLSWTLTQQEFGDPCISVLAEGIQDLLVQQLLPNCSYDCFPNVIYVDYFFPRVVGQAMAVNCLTNYALDLRTSPPFGLAASSTGMAMLYRDGQNRLNLLTAGNDATWTTQPVQLPATIESFLAPSAAYWNDILLIVYRGSGDQHLWSATQPNDWSDLVELVDTTTSTPAVAATLDQALAVFLSSAEDGTIFIASRSGQPPEWNPGAQQPVDITTFFTPAVAVMNQKLYVVYRSSTDSTMWFYQPDTGAGNQILPTDVSTLWSPAMTAMNGRLYVVYMSRTDQTMWTTNSADGENWNLPTQLPPVALTSFAPAITTLNGKLYVLYASAADGSVNQLSSTDGVEWEGPELVIANLP